MEEPLFTGVCTALVTPFLDGAVNYPMLEVLIRRQIDAGIRAIVICGTTGEAPTLTDSEKLQIFRRAKECAGTECLIIAGTGCNSTSHTAKMSIAAAQAGADALLIVCPYYNKPTQEGLAAHFLTVAHTVELPIILYNVPGRTGVDIGISVCQKLAYLPNIVGIKEAGADIRKIARLRHQCPELTVWVGNDDWIAPGIASGAQGVISVLSNLLPEETVRMTQAALSGDLHTASLLQQKLQRVIDLLFCETNPIPLKAAMRLVGYDCGDCRLPLLELSKEHTLALEACLADILQ